LGVRAAGNRVYGPVWIPAGLTPGQYGTLLTAAERAGAPLGSFARNGVIDNNRVKLVEISTEFPGGQYRSRSGISRNGIRFAGGAVWVGASTDFNEGSRLVLAHESSHMLLDAVDRYGFRRPLKGDVAAGLNVAGLWQTFVIDRLDDRPGPMTDGDRITLQAHDDDFMSVDPDRPNFVIIEFRQHITKITRQGT